MRHIELQAINAQQRLALVQACVDVAGGPCRGVPCGLGRHAVIPASITEDDMASGDMECWRGWTFYGPFLAFNLPETLAVDIEGAVGTKKVRTAQVLGLARAGLARGTHQPQLMKGPP